MTKKIDDGGPAFLICQWVGDAHAGHDLGMTLRDYFAAKAMQAMANEVLYENSDWPNNIATSAYQIADAMLVARQKTNGL